MEITYLTRSDITWTREEGAVPRVGEWVVRTTFDGYIGFKVIGVFWRDDVVQVSLSRPQYMSGLVVTKLPMFTLVSRGEL